MKRFALATLIAASVLLPFGPVAHAELMPLPEPTPESSKSPYPVDLGSLFGVLGSGILDMVECPPGTTKVPTGAASFACI